MIFMLIFLCSCLSATSPSIITRQSYGVIFTKVNKPFLHGYAEFKTTFQIDIPWARHLAPGLRLRLQQYVQEESWPRVTALLQEVNMLDSELTALMPNPKLKRPRLRKGLINVVGSVSKYLFGTASSDDLDKIWGAINNLRTYALDANGFKVATEKFLWHQTNLTNSRFNNMQSEIMELSSFMTAVSKSVNRTMRNIANNHDGLLALKTAVNKHTVALGNITHYFQSIELLQEMLQKQRAFIQALQALQDRVISPSLLLPRDIHRATYQVRHRLMSVHPLYKVVHADMQWYYYNSLHTVLYTKDALYLTLNVPVASLETIYTLWQITVLNVPLNTKTARKYDGYTRVEQLPWYLAVSESGSNFIELFQDQVPLCKQADKFDCLQPQLINTANEPTCAIALYLNNEDKMKQVCSHKYSTANVTDTRVLRVAPSQYIISTMQTAYQAICPNRQVRTEELCAYCLLKAPCGCTINIGKQKLRVPFSDCFQDGSVQITTKHTFNGGLAHEFDLTTSHNNSLGWFDRPVSVDLPSLSNFTTQLASLRRQDKLDKLKLKDLRAEYVKNTKDKNKGLWPVNLAPTEDIVFYVLSAISTVLSVLCLVLLVLGTRKLNRLNALVITLQGTDAAALPEVLLRQYSTPTPLVAPPIEPTLNTTMSTVELLLLGCLITLSVLTSVYTVTTCFTTFKRRMRRDVVQKYFESIIGPPQTTVLSVIYIVFDAPRLREHVVCTLTTLSTSPNMLQFACAPRLHAMSWLNASTVKLRWQGEPRLSVNVAIVDPDLPQVLHVPWALRTKLRKLYDSAELSTRLLLRYDEHGTYMQIPTSQTGPLTYTVPVQANRNSATSPPTEAPPKPARLYPTMGIGPLNIEVPPPEMIEMSTFKAPSAPARFQGHQHKDTPIPDKKLPAGYWSPYSDGDEDA
jgi:hypothetical protein